MERKRVSVWRLIRRHLLWVPIIPLIATLVLGAISRSESSKARALDAHGVETIGMITQLSQRTRRVDGRTKTEYFMHFAFQPGTGPQVQQTRAISRDRYVALHEGDEIRVRYVAHDPQITELQAGDRATSGTWAFWLSVIAGVITLGAGTWAIRRKLSVLRAALNGEVRQAEVIAHLASNTRVNNVLQFRLSWRDALGAEGQSGLFNPARLPPVGNVIVVYVDPKSGKGYWDEEF